MKPKAATDLMLALTDILVPVDFSRSSRNAVTLARDICERSGATMRLVHFVPPVLRYLETTLFPMAALGDDRAAIQAEICKVARRDLVRTHSLPDREARKREKRQAQRDDTSRPDVEVAVCDGGEEHPLTSMLASSHAEVVVMGARGDSGQVPGVLGSTALRVLAASTRPVLLAKEAASPIRRVLVAVDLSKASVPVLQTALEAALLFGASLEAVVVVATPDVADVGGVVSSMVKGDRAAINARTARAARKQLERHREAITVPFAHKEHSDALRFVDTVLHGDAVGEIARRVDETDVDLCVFGLQGEGGGKLAGGMGRTALALAACVPSHVLLAPT